MIQLIIVLLIATGCYLLVKIYYLIDKLESKALESITESGYNKLKQKKIMENEKWIPKIGDYLYWISQNDVIKLGEELTLIKKEKVKTDAKYYIDNIQENSKSNYRKALPHEIPNQEPELIVGNWYEYLYDNKWTYIFKFTKLIDGTASCDFFMSNVDGPFKRIEKKEARICEPQKCKPSNMEQVYTLFPEERPKEEYTPKKGDYYAVEGLAQYKGQFMLSRYDEEYTLPKDPIRSQGPLISDFNISIGKFKFELKGSLCFKSELGDERKARLATPDEIKWLNACIAANKFIPKEEALKTTEFKVGDWIYAIKPVGSSKAGDIEKLAFYGTDNGIEKFIPESCIKKYPKKEGWDYSKNWRLATPEEIAKVTGKKEEPMNTYGLKVGDKISSKIGDAWGIKGNWFNSGTWQKWKGWSSDRTIEKFQKTPDGITICTLSNCALGVHGLKAKGFKEFMDNFDKPKFEVGRWYKTKLGSYVRYKRTDVTTFISSENIMYDTKVYENIEGKFGSIDNNKFTLLADLSEIQQYLPDGHPDKIVQPKSLIGRYLKALVNQAQCIGICKAGDYFLVTDKDSVQAKDGSRWGFRINDGTGEDKYWELMPEGFIPPVKSEIPEYVKVLNTGCRIDSSIKVGQIYKVHIDPSKTYYFGFLLDNKERVGCEKEEFYHYFENSTKEAYDTQFVQKQPIPPETLPNAKQFVEWVECIEKLYHNYNKYFEVGSKYRVLPSGKIQYNSEDKGYYSWLDGGITKYFKPCNMKEEDWCVLRTEENTESIIKFFKDKYNFLYSGNGTYYGEKSSEIKRHECSSAPWCKVLTTEEFYVKIGKTPVKQKSNNPFNIGDKVLYRNEEVTILGFNHKQDCAVVEGILNGHSGDMSDYWCDKKGNRIPYYSSGKMDRYYIGIVDLKPISSSKSLIDQAREKYPVGTKFISPHNNRQYTVVKHTYNGDGFYLDDRGKNVLCHVNSYSGDYVYYEGKWAEIVSKPEEDQYGDYVVASAWTNVVQDKLEKQLYVAGVDPYRQKKSKGWIDPTVNTVNSIEIKLKQPKKVVYF